MTTTSPCFSLHVDITVAPENHDKFLEALKPAWDAVIAEPENIFFEVFHQPEEPGKFKFVEIWNASIEWMYNVQLKKSYYEPYLAATVPMFIKPREHSIWQRIPGGKWAAIDKTAFP